MASEPKKPIEEMLEASAKARQAAFGSDPKMPNPMRARLHDEVARVGRDQEEEPRGSWLQMFWPRIAVAAAVATLLVVAPTMWWNRSHPESGGTMQLAKLEENAERPTSNVERRMQNGAKETEAVPPEQTFANGPAAAGAAAPNVTLDDNSRAKIEAAQTPQSAATSLDETKRIAEARATPFTWGGGQITKGLMAGAKKDAELDKANAAIAPAAPAAAAPLARAGASSAESEHRLAADAVSKRGATQQFEEGGLSFRNNSVVSQTANILNSFQVQQTGTEIRVVDSDGSTYTGKLEPVAQAVGRAAAKLKQGYGRREDADNKAATPQSRFRASGYNVSLKKPLVFEGDYTAPAQQQQPQQFQSNDTAQTAERQEPARIIGTARVHGETPVQVDATAVLPTPTATKAER